ncbi:MAG: BamA/TamA family outer membrane protein [Alphaproteobacteria bacterium]|nr:BamA/TamA family outer membrane protein [Alphaproteobacteria bacterium]MBU1516457.1 BamA/TamA family outer membrane protein [Alphaproteobacteria bacterium]MBU2094214.1 BamA/TamA family outer membrane protein [Alphaproteobacteria bacterium]MBU2154209.1 BamA/TamA family outer membrane protein [Alphaproteobacteria bacterium]MBU2307384.1 BamA/TamA family outer membrane protein [Alphaproteobacteria bacterium]
MGSRLCLLALATTALTPATAAWGQPAPATATPGTTAAELNPDTRVSRPPPARGAGAFAPEPPGPCPLETSDVQVTLNSVSFRGATAVSETELRDAYAEYLGKPQPVSVICRIRDRAARIVFDNGVLARVEIPEQRIAGGALVLEVIEAQVVNVRVRGDVGPAQAAIERYAEKLRGMKPFDMAKAQRYLLLASDVPGLRVRAAVRPSTSLERGAVDIDLTVTRQGPTAFANVQNTGSKSVGRWGGLLRGDLAGYTAYGESTSITAFHTLDSNEQWLVQLAESARFGSEGLTARGAFTYGESRPGAALKPLDLKSQSIVGNLEVAYPYIRTRNRNLNVAGGLDIVDQETKAGGLGLLSRDKLRVVYARADGDYRTEVSARPVLLTGGLALRKGLSFLGGSDAGDPTLTRALGKPEAWVLKAQGGGDIAITDRLTGMVRAQAQYSDDVLLPYEQMSLGGLTVGRGYDPAALLGDKGVSAAFEVRYGPMPLHPKIMAAPYAFVDAGYVANNNVAATGLQKDRSLTSVGAGVIFRLFNRANLEVTYAHPLHATNPGGRRPGDRVLIQLTASLL